MAKEPEPWSSKLQDSLLEINVSSTRVAFTCGANTTAILVAHRPICITYHYCANIYALCPRSIILSSLSEKLLDIEGDETTTLNLIHDSLEIRMALLKTIEVGYVHSSLYFFHPT